jgi:cytochrome c peroxidase
MNRARGEFAIVPASYALLIGIATLLSGITLTSAADQDAIQPIVRDQTAGNASKIRLGERLFRDPILSNDNNRSCATCHDIDTNGTTPITAFAHRDPDVRFNVPSIFDVGLNFRFGWRGDFSTLTEQNDSAVQNPPIMDATWPDIIERMNRADTYGRDFIAVYGENPSKDRVLDALLAFQLSLVTPSPFDDYLAGDQTAISEDAKAGYRLFRDYGCVSCHQGSNVGGNMFQKFGIFATTNSASEVKNRGDLGRATVTGRDEDIGVFRVPSLRNVAETAPYLHDGRSSTLPETIRIMGWNQLGRDLDSSDVAKLDEFLKSLTGTYNGRKLHAPGP